jgi:hypothetical protein
MNRSGAYQRDFFSNLIIPKKTKDIEKLLSSLPLQGGVPVGLNLTYSLSLKRRGNR